MMCRPGPPRDRTRQILQSAGVGPERIDFVDYQPRRQYLQTYNSIDIGLDTLPYNGHTTSLDSYWMGVPVVTLVGKSAVGRAGFSQLTNLGLAQLAADSQDQFIRIATGLASDLKKLDALRQSLRTRMSASPLMNAPQFARDIESAFRGMWIGFVGADPRVRPL
jgi:predicted O-linked N-acetylglucosamine transferase (SPINDLY family)